MENDHLLPFDDLVALRQQLQTFCGAHSETLTAFQDGVSFKIYLADPPSGSTARHLSSTATCFESLLSWPESRFIPSVASQATEFSRLAMLRSPAEWLSDGSASIYCKCRALPLVVNHLPVYQPEINALLEVILHQLKEDTSRLAIGEASGSKKEEWYAPNAFHTYWTLELLNALERKFPNDFLTLEQSFADTRFSLCRIRAEMTLWAKSIAGYQMALHSSQSSTLDSDQLAWSLSILFTFAGGFQASLGQQDFLRHGLKCLFDEQTSSGIWRTGAPLFHYKDSGNAYCYVFETFTILLKAALNETKEGAFLRRELRQYVRQLGRLWSYALSTQIPIDQKSGLLAWSSGHRPNRKDPESWATASVFSFSQNLRRLVGIWTREKAAEQLKVSHARKLSNKALELLKERGDTWCAHGNSTAIQLITLFVNPTQISPDYDSLEPDSKPIAENQARAAILFGPPGTSKTTLSRSVADAIGWDYIELHASHFVADGLPNVQSTADKIFGQLMQLDRTVILFDEIDELVRTRDEGADAFGRFLTTSMLPKLAELWQKRKVIYFVATNHIRFFDPAVTRAQRFDALINVAPPSFDRKMSQIDKLLREKGLNVTGVEFNLRDVERALDSIEQAVHQETDERKVDKLKLPPGGMAGKFLLLRWDQLQELASAIKRLRSKDAEIVLTTELMLNALAEISDPSLKTCGPFRDYLSSREYEGHDFSKVNVWEVIGDIPNAEEVGLVVGNDRRWFKSQSRFDDFSGFPGTPKVLSPGLLGLETV